MTDKYKAYGYKPGKFVEAGFVSTYNPKPRGMSCGTLVGIAVVFFVLAIAAYLLYIVATSPII